MNELIKTKIDNIPTNPGVYLMKNINEEVIYVGKAKSLKKRVPQYFLRPHEGKTQKMVNDVVDFDVIITSNEREALILETNLIHKYDPKYNILLKDDKTYPYIEITNDEHPFIKIARKVKNKKSTFFGPYPDSKAAYEILNLLNRIFPLRKCNKIPKEECLYYHMHQCLGPCIKNITKEDYDKVILDIKKIMKGDTKDLVNSLKEDMYNYSDNLEFEKAKECKDTIDRIEYIISKQKVEFSDKKDRDVFAFHTKNGYISIAILMFNNGMLSLKDTKTFSYLEDENEALINFIYDFYQKHRLPKQIILPPLNDLDLLEEILDTNIIVPSRGLKFDLLQMAGENAIKAMEDQHMIKVIKEDKFNLLKTLGDLLNIEIPKRIELIDNSHIQGDAAVGTVVVYVNGETSKNDYRKYKITNDDKKDDLSSMHEVLYRRYYRLLTEGGTISDLLIVDGGYNQLKVAKETLSSLGFSNVKIAGLVKDNNHRTRGLINENGEEILLPNDHALLFFLTRMQDEVHRFAISFHHNLRSKSISSSFLDTIEGIGPKRKELLFKTFGSLKKIKEAPLEELTQYIPLSLAKKIKEIND